MKCLSLHLLLLGIAGLGAQTARAASTDLPDPSVLEEFLHHRYYEVEFFVFERPQVLDFATDEILTLNRPRALPRSVRTQVLDPDALWNLPLDPKTRSCLTFPTLTYELLPGEERIPVETDTAAQSVPVPVPVPEIEPRLAPDAQLDFLASMADYERTLIENSQRWQTPEQFQLSRYAARIERRGGGRILFHGRWLQAVPPREQPDPILITGGEALEPPYPSHELIGTVGVTIGRYLHFRADLYFQGPALGLVPVGAALMDGQAKLIATEPLPDGYMALAQSRRMRSGELHYLDHPKLGLVVRIDPVQFPEALIQAYVALEESDE
jgi:hypothetical protein